MSHGEIWRPIPNAIRYEASSFGQIRSKDHMDSLGRIWRGHLLPQRRNNMDYCIVDVFSDSDVRCRPTLVHRLVCAAFNGAPTTGENVARHVDNNHLNNVPHNLKWGTQLDNIRDKAAHGTQTRGDTHGLSKLTSDQVRDVRVRLARGEVQRLIAAHYGVSQSAISLIKLGRNWSHIGDAT